MPVFKSDMKYYEGLLYELKRLDLPLAVNFLKSKATHIFQWMNELSDELIFSYMFSFAKKPRDNIERLIMNYSPNSQCKLNRDIELTYKLIYQYLDLEDSDEREEKRFDECYDDKDSIWDRLRTHLTLEYLIRIKVCSLSSFQESWIIEQYNNYKLCESCILYGKGGLVEQDFYTIHEKMVALDKEEKKNKDLFDSRKICSLCTKTGGV